MIVVLFQKFNQKNEFQKIKFKKITNSNHLNKNKTFQKNINILI